MTRTILIHLNVEVPDEDTRDYKDIVSDVEGAIEVGSDPEHVGHMTVDVALAEEIA